MTEPQPEAVAEHFDIGYDTADEGEVHAPSSNGIISAISTGASSGANSLAASLGAGVVHGITYMGAAGATAVVKGIANGLTHFASGVNPLAAADDEEEIDQEPLKPFPKAKARAKSSYWGGSSGSQEKPKHEKPKPHAFPAQPFVDVRPFNGGVFDVSSEEEARPAAAAAAPAAPRRSRLARRDVKFAQETVDADPHLGRRRG